MYSDSVRNSVIQSNDEQKTLVDEAAGEYVISFPGLKLTPMQIDGIPIRALEFCDGEIILRGLSQSLSKSVLPKGRRAYDLGKRSLR
jgi:hypothetical protein